MAIEGKDGGKAGRRLRLGMVGGGQGAFIGGVHRIAARIDDRYQLVAGALSSDPARAKASAAELAIADDRAYGSFAEMAEAEGRRDDGIDVVAIVTPNHVHHAAAKTFLANGIHVICDKPLTTSLEAALDLVAEVRRTGLVFALTHNYTGYPMVRQAREMGRQLTAQVHHHAHFVRMLPDANLPNQARINIELVRKHGVPCAPEIHHETLGFLQAERVNAIDRTVRDHVDLLALRHQTLDPTHSWGVLGRCDELALGQRVGLVVRELLGSSARLGFRVALGDNFLVLVQRRGQCYRVWLDLRDRRWGHRRRKQRANLNDQLITVRNQLVLGVIGQPHTDACHARRDLGIPEGRQRDILHHAVVNTNRGLDSVEHHVRKLDDQPRWVLP